MVLGAIHHRNPRDLVPSWALDVIALWALCRGGMGGYAQLPQSGGMGDQPAWLLDAFNACGAVEVELSKERDDDRQR